jgi:hypothetical protein
MDGTLSVCDDLTTELDKLYVQRIPKATEWRSTGFIYIFIVDNTTACRLLASIKNCCHVVRLSKSAIYLSIRPSPLFAFFLFLFQTICFLSWFHNYTNLLYHVLAPFLNYCYPCLFIYVWPSVLFFKIKILYILL